MSNLRNAYDILLEWEQWEADIIKDDKAWSNNQMTINGAHYEKMLELQIKRNQIKKSLAGEIWSRNPTCRKCNKPLSRCSCAY